MQLRVILTSKPATVVPLGQHASPLSVLTPVLVCSHVVLTIPTCIPAAPDASPPLSSSSGSVPDYVGNDLGGALSTPERMRPDHAWCGPGSLFRIPWLDAAIESWMHAGVNVLS